MSAMRTIPGRFFGGAVQSETAAAPAVEEKRSLPDAAFRLLTSLPSPKDPAEQAEFQSLLAEHHALNVRTQAYVDRKLGQLRAGLEEDHEAAKAAVREQLELIETIKGQYSEAAAEWHRTKNVVVQATLKRDEAQQAAKSISRFATSAAIAAAQRKWVTSEEELSRASEPESAALQEMNHINLTLLPEALKKRDELIEAEARLAAILAGKDPDLATLGFMSRT